MKSHIRGPSTGEAEEGTLDVPGHSQLHTEFQPKPGVHETLSQKQNKIKNSLRFKAYIYLHIVCVCVCMCICLLVDVYMCMYIGVFVWIYVFVYMCMCVFMCNLQELVLPILWFLGIKFMLGVFVC